MPFNGQNDRQPPWLWDSAALSSTCARSSTTDSRLQSYGDQVVSDRQAGAVLAQSGVAQSGEATSRRSIALGLFVAIAQTAALGIAAFVTNSAALKTQTATNLADVAVSSFLLIAVVRGVRPADDEHPLGHGRERFFWSFVAAIGIFVGGVGAAIAETLETLLHPEPTGSYLVGYVVLAVVVSLDVIALVGGLRPLRRAAKERGLPLTTFVWQGTDPAITTLVLSTAAGVAGGVVAAAGLAGRQFTGSSVTDAAASALIGLILLVTSVVLLHTNRSLLTGRSVPQSWVTEMRRLVAAQPDVVAVPDLFAILVGPSSVIVEADVIFEDGLNVPQVEEIIADTGMALRARWPSVAYVYLNPVARHRPRRFGSAPASREDRP
jgi:cation diffusion facilitator family transporter